MGEQITYSTPEAESSSVQNELSYYAVDNFRSIIKSKLSSIEKTELFSRLCRYNVLYMVNRAGSGHIGSSFSSLDFISYFYLKIRRENDIFFSSKGHDAPAMYSAQIGLEEIPFDYVHKLRRLGGLPGHPDVTSTHSRAVTNTGSLGMGISKAKGFLKANELSRLNGRVFVLLGDGELQEGQIWESLISLKKQPSSSLFVIVDKNNFQSDYQVRAVGPIDPLEDKFQSFGFVTTQCNGNDIDSINAAYESLNRENLPKLLILNTIKGFGVKQLEPQNLSDISLPYKYHSGALAPSLYEEITKALEADIKMKFLKKDLPYISPVSVANTPMTLPGTVKRLINIYSDELVKLGQKDKRVVAYDADLMIDTGVINFKEKFPDRFVECGIAEQDMLSQVSALALSGFTPIAHSFACFLTTRANEQIYNCILQGSRFVIVGSLAGLLPAAPGSSHQAVRDIASLTGMPGLKMIQPVNQLQIKSALELAADSNQKHSFYIRLCSVPFESNELLEKIELPKEGEGNVLCEGTNIAIVAYSPVLLTEALNARVMLTKAHADTVKIIAAPWLRTIDTSWYADVLGGVGKILVLEDHYSDSGVGVALQAAMNPCQAVTTNIEIIGLSNIPKCGRNDEILELYGLDAKSLKHHIEKIIKENHYVV